MTKKNDISAIIPVFNCERYLAEAIDSVLSQSYAAGEVIVIDDGSTDNSAAAAKRFGPAVKYFYQENAGLGAARNRGVSAASGEYLAFLDSDDLWEKEKLLLQISAFEKDPELDCVFGRVRQFHCPTLNEAEKRRWAYSAEFLDGYIAGTMMIKKGSFLKYGAFSDALILGEFLDWYFRAKDGGLQERMIPEVVMNRRLHGKNMVIRERDSRSDYLKVIKAALDRRRSAVKP